MKQLLEEGWIPIVNVRLAHAESALQSWLDDRGLSQDDIPKADLAQEVSRLIGGGSGSTYYVRRPRLLKLLASGRLKTPPGRTYASPTEPVANYSAVRILSRRLESQGAPEGTIAWIVDRDADGGGYRYQLDVTGADDDTRRIRSVERSDFKLLDSPIGLDE